MRIDFHGLLVPALELEFALQSARDDAKEAARLA